MNAIRRKSLKAWLTLICGILAILFLSAFSSPTHVLPQQQMDHARKSTTVHGSYSLKPGQDFWVHLPGANRDGPDSVAALHVELNTGDKEASSLVAITSSAIVDPLASSCITNINARVTEYTPGGATGWYYQISLDFCYNGSSLTSLSKIRVTDYANVFYGVSSLGTHHDYYSGEKKAYAYGNYNACYLGCIDSRSGYAQINFSGDGTYYLSGMY